MSTQGKGAIQVTNIHTICYMHIYSYGKLVEMTSDERKALSMTGSDFTAIPVDQKFSHTAQNKGKHNTHINQHQTDNFCIQK